MKELAWLLAALFAVNLAFCARELLRAWRGLSGRDRWLLPLTWLGLWALVLWLTRDTPIRGGYDNEHDFGYLGFRLSRFLIGFVHDKETAPQLFFALFDRLSGFSLEGILAGQKALWAACSLLAFGSARRAGLGAGGAAAAALLLGLDWLALLNVYTVATTYGNLFLLLCALYALAAWWGEDDPGRALAHLAWLAAASPLILFGRYEFAPALGLGFALSLLCGRWRALAALWRVGPRSRWAMLSLAAASAGAAAFAAIKLASITNYRGTWPAQEAQGWAGHLHYQLVRSNLAALWDGAPERLWLLVAPMLLIGALAGRWRRGWGVFMGLCLLYFSAIYIPMDRYPLHFMRHQLYFFVPAAFLLAAAGDRILAAMPRWAPLGARFGVGAALLAVYGGFNLSAARARDSEWRTNDREWRLLLRARRSWPAGCGVALPRQSSRYDLLEKYFPPARIPGTDCILLYRSAAIQVIRPPRPPGPPPDLPPSVYGAPFLEERFPHRFYTNWPASPDADWEQRQDAVGLRIGFYHAPAAGVPAPVAGGRNDPAVAWKEIKAGIHERQGLEAYSSRDFEAAVREFALVCDLEPGRASAHLSLAVALGALGRSARALAAYDRAVRTAESDRAGPPQLLADALDSRAWALSASGRAADARRDLERALKVAPPGWPRRARVEAALRGGR